MVLNGLKNKKQKMNVGVFWGFLWPTQSPDRNRMKCFGMTLNRSFTLENPPMWMN